MRNALTQNTLNKNTLQQLGAFNRELSELNRHYPAPSCTPGINRLGKVKKGSMFLPPTLKLGK